MNIETPYYYFKEALTPKLCDDIITHCSKDLKLAIIGDEFHKKRHEKEGVDEETAKRIKNKRQSDVAFFDDRWIYKEIQPYVDIANKDANWNFDWDHSEHIQFTKYALNQHYGWHTDSSPRAYVDVPDVMKGKIRKLSVSICLSNAEDYTGGELQFDLRNDCDYENSENSILTCSEITQKGTIIVFPSFMWHRVTPVTSGTRYSLVMWNLGKPWR